MATITAPTHRTVPEDARCAHAPRTCTTCRTARWRRSPASSARRARSVSRLLSHARATGIVDIRIRSPLEAAAAASSSEILERFGVAAHVVPVPDDASDVERLERVAVVGCTHARPTSCDSNHDDRRRLGLDDERREPAPRAEGHVTTPSSCSSTERATRARPGILYASEILSRFAAAYGGTASAVPGARVLRRPAHASSAMWRERSTQRILDHAGPHGRRRVQRRLADFAAVPSHVYAGGYLEPEDFGRSRRRRRRRRRRDRVLPRRRHRATASRSTSARPGRTSTCCAGSPRRICVVSGRAKLASLRGALAAGLDHRPRRRRGAPARATRRRRADPAPAASRDMRE